MSNHALVPTKFPATFDSKTIKRIPSLELQTLAFMSAAREQHTLQEIRLSWNGFHISLGFEPNPPVRVAGDLKDIFYIFDMYVPPKYRLRGWLTRYWQLCQKLAGGSLIILGSPPQPLRDSLLRHGFKEVGEYFWVIRAE